MKSLRENAFFEGGGLRAVHLTTKMDRLQPLRAALSQRKTCPQGLKPVLVWVATVRAEARTLQEREFSRTL